MNQTLPFGSGVHMLRTILLISALAIPATGVLAQNRPEPIKTSGFVEVKPSGKPFATAPVRSAAATPHSVPNARRAPMSGAEAILPPDDEPATQDSPDDSGGGRRVVTTQSQPQQTVQIRHSSSQPSDPSAEPDDPDKDQDTADKEPSDEGSPDDAGDRPPAAGGQPTEED
jgi:hypothetical protein